MMYRLVVFNRQVEAGRESLMHFSSHSLWDRKMKVRRVSWPNVVENDFQTFVAYLASRAFREMLGVHGLVSLVAESTGL